MFGALSCIFSFIGVLFAARRSRGHAIAVLATVGYAYGILRARFLDGASHFTFDSALLALYLMELARRPDSAERAPAKSITRWVIVLSVWPVACILYSPLVDGQHILIQLVGLRAWVLMIPLGIVGAGLSRHDLAVVARALAILNLAALAFAAIEISYGVTTFFPENAVSEIVYASHDVGEDMLYRIPSTFSSSHAYGGTVLLTLPFLVDLFQGGGKRRDPWLAMAGIFAAVIGVFLCAARQPVVELGIAFAIVLLSTRPTGKNIAAFAAIAVGAALIIGSSERFQRFITLSDTDYVRERIAGSVNKSFFDIVSEYPLGAGLGSAFGTSIPFFLWQYARPAIGIESEYGHIAVEQGLVGLALWCAFVAWLLVPRFSGRGAFSSIAERLTWALLVSAWGSALLGAGLLTSIPGTAFFMLLSGVLSGSFATNVVGSSVPDRHTMKRPTNDESAAVS